MIYTSWKDYRLSRLMLGTVQFGMSYGVANRTGQPSYDDVLAIVKAAIEGGVNCFDTAAAYGASEELLGKAIQELGAVGEAVVVTKVRALADDEIKDAALSASAIEDSVAQSRRRLRLSCLPVVLFHREQDAAYLPILDSLRRRGWLQYLGVSCSNRPGPAAEFVEAASVDALQLPDNVMDGRHRRTMVLESASARDIGIFIRSVYLQGLLVMPEDEIPSALRAVIPVRRKLGKLAGEAGMPLSELALRYMLSLDGATTILVGVETVSQIRDNIQMFDRGGLDLDLRQAVDASVSQLPEPLLTPSMWPDLDA